MSQIFQKPIPSSLLFNFIEPYCDKTDNNYLLFSKVAFKKMKLKENSIQNFYDSIKKYYYNSKQYYLERDKTYKNLITIIRQICKFNNIDSHHFICSVYSIQRSRNGRNFNNGGFNEI